jgi:hypothetical protein
MRHAGSDVLSFVTTTIGHAAGLSTREDNSTGILFQKLVFRGFEIDDQSACTGKGAGSKGAGTYTRPVNWCKCITGCQRKVPVSAKSEEATGAFGVQQF